MKKIKVSIKDENTLVLLEPGAEGDIIDLTSLHDVDIDTSTIGIGFFYRYGPYKLPVENQNYALKLNIGISF